MVENIADLIKGIIYTEFHEELGPNPILCDPPDISPETRMLISIKTITILSGEEHSIPKTLIVLPLPSIQKKGLIKYIERHDESRRGGMALSAITILFDEANDVVFYKYIEDFQPIFDELGQKIGELEEKKADKEEFSPLIEEFKRRLTDLLNFLRNRELGPPGAKAFPKKEASLEKEYQYKFKIIVVGDPSVGKTSTILRFTDNAFKRTYIPTIGVSITEKAVMIREGIKIQLVLWDIAGQEKFGTIRTHFYEKAEGMFIVFDLTRKETFNNLVNWYQDIKKSVKAKYATIGFILGNKSDLINERAVSREDAEKLAKEINCEYIETSALLGENVQEAFEKIAQTLVNLKKILKLQRS